MVTAWLRENVGNTTTVKSSSSLGGFTIPVLQSKGARTGTSTMPLAFNRLMERVVEIFEETDIRADGSTHRCFLGQKLSLQIRMGGQLVLGEQQFRGGQTVY